MRDLLSFLGLAKRAGKLAAGNTAVTEAIGTAKLICLAEDLTPGSVKRVKRVAEKIGVPIVTLPHTKNDLGRVLGRKPCGILALTDQGFASSVIEAIGTGTHS